MNGEYESNLPTEERKNQADKDQGLALILHPNQDLPIAKVIDPLRLDKLFSAGIIDNKMHKHGLRFYTLWNVVGRQFLTAMRYDDPTLAVPRNPNEKELGTKYLYRLSAQDQFYDIIVHLKKKRCYRFLTMVCFEEKGLIETAAILKINKRYARTRLHEAFEHLEVALDLASDKRKRFEKALESE